MGVKISKLYSYNRGYLAPQICCMNNRFHSEAKLSWSYDCPLANHIVTNKSSANREIPVLAPLHFFQDNLRKIIPPFKILPILFQPSLFWIFPVTDLTKVTCWDCEKSNFELPVRKRLIFILIMGPYGSENNATPSTAMILFQTKFFWIFPVMDWNFRLRGGGGCDGVGGY